MIFKAHGHTNSKRQRGIQPFQPRWRFLKLRVLWLMFPLPQFVCVFSRRMTGQCDRKRIGGEGRVRGFFFEHHVSPTPPHPACRPPSPPMRGRRDRIAQLQNWRFGLALNQQTVSAGNHRYGAAHFPDALAVHVVRSGCCGRKNRGIVCIRRENLTMYNFQGRRSGRCHTIYATKNGDDA